MEHRIISAVFGPQQREDGGFVIAHAVGSTSYVSNGERFMKEFTVTGIARRTEGFGNYGISWFDVSSANGVELSVQAMAVAEVHYAPESVA